MANWTPADMPDLTGRSSTPATAPGVAGGDYYGPAQHIRGRVARAHMSARARDASSVEKLWRASEDLTGVAFAL